MRPRRQRVLRNPEAPLLLVPGGCRLNEPDDTILTKAVQVSIGIDQRSLSHTPIAPRNLTRIKLDRRQYGAREPVQVIANQHRAAVMIAHILREPDLLRLVVRLDLDHATA